MPSWSSSGLAGMGEVSSGSLGTSRIRDDLARLAERMGVEEAHMLGLQAKA